MPGQPGTKKLLEKYGKDLVCVRYRYDMERKRKIKTVELIVDEGPWEYDPGRIPLNKIVSIRIEYGEMNLSRAVKTAGGKWNREKKVWQLPYKEVIDLGLKDRMNLIEK